MSRPAVHAGAGVVHDRALRARPRRLHELGRDRGRLADLRVGAAEAGYHTALVGKAHLYRDEIHDGAHVDDLAPRLQALGFTEVHETGDKFAGSTPNRYTDHLHERGLLDAYRQHIADRSYQGDNESGQNATKRVPMWDATPMPLPLDAYIDAGTATRPFVGSSSTTAPEPFFLFVGFPGPHDPWDAPQEAVDRYRERRHLDADAPTRRPDGRRHWPVRRVARLVPVAVGHRDDDRRRDPRYAARVQRRRLRHRRRRRPDRRRARAPRALDETWLIYTSDHGEMGGNHGLMSKCVLYEPAVRVPLIVRPPARVLAAHRRRARRAHRRPGFRARRLRARRPSDERRPLAARLRGRRRPARRANVSVSENWGFACFETDRYKLVVDEDALEPCQLFDLADDPDEDHEPARRSDAASRVVDELMETLVRPFFARRRDRTEHLHRLIRGRRPAGRLPRPARPRCRPPSFDALQRLHRRQVERVPYETMWIHAESRGASNRSDRSSASRVMVRWVLLASQRRVQ